MLSVTLIIVFEDAAECGFSVMTAEAVLQSMVTKYSSMKSYQDRGVVLTKWPDKPEPDEINFATVFRRPDRFRFDWTSHHPYPPLRHLKTQHVVWYDGANAFHYTEGEDGGIKLQESLFMAIAGATGISKGSALTVFNMLMPEIGAVSFTNLRSLQLREDVIEGTSCHWIRGQNFQGDQQDVYIGIDDYMLRSVSTVRHNGVVSSEIRREIYVDPLIDEDKFQFHSETGGQTPERDDG
jgi:outer membrane lipoprotein-sorting protein